MVSTFKEAMSSMSVVYAGVIPAALNSYCLYLLGPNIFKLCPCQFMTDKSFFGMHKDGNVGITGLGRE